VADEARLAPSYPVLTPRLRLQPLTEADIDEMLVYRGREDVCRYLPFAPMTRKVLRARFAAGLGRSEITAAGQALTLGVRLQATGALLGDVVLFFHSATHASGELGYVFAPEAAGYGYATEACRAVLDFAFAGLALHRVSARLDARNTSSARLAHRLGMRQEAHLIEDEMFKGEWSDTVIFGMLDREWSAAAAGQARP